MEFYKRFAKYIYARFKFRQSRINFSSNWDVHSKYGRRLCLGKNSSVINSVLGDHVILEELSSIYQSALASYVKIHRKAILINVEVQSFTYIASGAQVSNTEIGKYCSIGPEVIIGYGTHPTNYLSTSPVFYSNSKLQLGLSFTDEKKFEEHIPGKIGNDVWIGARAIILDGITIGDGAIIAAGAVVTKDVAPFSIVGGVPAKHLKFRFSDEVIADILKDPWWNWSDTQVKKNLSVFQGPIREKLVVNE